MSNHLYMSYRSLIENEYFCLFLHTIYLTHCALHGLEDGSMVNIIDYSSRGSEFES